MDVGEITKHVTRRVRFNSDVVRHLAQLAIRKLGTTSLGHGDIEGAGDPVASFPVGAGKTGVGVIRQDLGQSVLAFG